MKEITIGRSSDNTLVLQDGRVSQHHCRCFLKDNQYYIEDLKSTNGVKVGDAKISAITPFTHEQVIVIGGQQFSGKELIDKIDAQDNVLDSIRKFKDKYDDMLMRYRTNIAMVEIPIKIDLKPYKEVFAQDDDKISYFVNQYQSKVYEAGRMLNLIQKHAISDEMTLAGDMDAMAELCKVAPIQERRLCIEIRQTIQERIQIEMRQIFEKLKRTISEFNVFYSNIFNDYYETLDSQSVKWQDISNTKIVSTSYILYQKQIYTYCLFSNSVEFPVLRFLPFLRNGNVMVKYDSYSRHQADDIVNCILGRLLAGSQSGNVQIHTIDVYGLGGTSNVFKMLDKHVFDIAARSEYVHADLSALDYRVENVVQNLLQGPYDSLEAYNYGKEKQEPYQIVVLKDFPYGITQECAHIIQRILINGIKAGVYFIFMINQDIVHQQTECEKVYHIMCMDAPNKLISQEIDLTKQNAIPRSIIKNQILGDNILQKIVQYVNTGFEIKEEEVLRLTDYVIPENEWWSRHSANRVDIPFGMAQNKQIQKLNITQESGQNTAIVIGIPGSGKSVFLHTVIANSIINYSPNELQMYLLDFSGVEFEVYARHNLPHARVIAPEAEREFGLSILREVFEEGNRRMNLCRQYGVTNIVELKQKKPEMIVPRLLVIIDEFQKIFEVENDKISQESNQKIHAIIQEYRKFGINLILATQKLPSKGVVPYDLIANRVVFKSDPNDFGNLIHWGHINPQPRLLTGICVYNNESGAEVANSVVRSFFINASSELDELLDKVSKFAQTNPQMIDKHELLVFRSNELPEFRNRLLSERHVKPQMIPKEVGIYVGESISISDCDVYVPLVKDSNNNILIIGGDQDVAKAIEYHALFSEVACHTEKSSNILVVNCMMNDDVMNEAFNSDIFLSIRDYCNVEVVSTSADVLDFLQNIKDEVIDKRKADSSAQLSHIFINIFEFQRGRMFDGTGGRGDMQSECSRLLEYILRNGPMVGVFTILQVDTLQNLNRLCYSAQNMFNHRIALQMSESDSDKVVGNSAANKLFVLNRPATKFRGLYYNNINNSIVKFKPYKYGSNN